MNRIQYQYFPKSCKITSELEAVVRVFSDHYDNINSSKNNLESNKVLEFLRIDLETLGFKVEKGKKQEEKILVPVLYGINGQLEQRFDADAYNTNSKIVIEVEAGRAVTNYQFLKDLFEACVMSEVEYLIIAVRNEYSNRKDFEKVITFFNTLYASNRLKLPLLGILIIGY